MGSELYQLKTPVAVCFFNRTDTIQKVIESLKKVKAPIIYLISDGGRNEKEKQRINEVRQSVENMIDWECSIKKNYAQENMGCDKRIVTGLNWVFEQEEYAIFLEDDIVPVTDFYRYMDIMLDMYKDDSRVMMISGWNGVSPVVYEIKEAYVVSSAIATLGWGTWKDAWETFGKDFGRKKAKEIFNMATRISVYAKRYGKLAEMKYLTCVNRQLMKNTVIPPWDYFWGLYMLLNEAYCIVPQYNMIQNIGFGEMATHTQIKTFYDGITKRNKFPICKKQYLSCDRIYDSYVNKEVTLKELPKVTISEKMQALGYYIKLWYEDTF